MNLTVYPINQQELTELMLEDAPKLGWYYSPEDIEFYFNHRGNRIFAIRVNTVLAGVVILHRSLSYRYNNPVYSVGFFLVREQYRGKKLVGPKLWHEAITVNLTAKDLVCFHSAERAINYYEKLGFKKTPFIDLLYVLNINNLDKNQFKSTGDALATGVLKQIKPSEFKDIDHYNKDLFCGSLGLGFCEFIDDWMQRSDATIVAYYEQEKLAGYGISTICQRTKKIGYRISPLYANNSLIARTLLKGLVYLAYQNQGQLLELNTPASNNREFRQILQDLGFVEDKGGRSIIVCNQAELIHENSAIAQKKFCCLPLEYPPEIIMGLD
ncbi:GNAT family acetyltransferase [Legionella nautarum]|uniref:GNAT family acetyltransferase n=1 Tax=Legionella nautarum TaxID=45070 RepID=A0A0W0WM12_9GAMM|nr:GNAT family N-acetyltransferase [Legionella nautarum]KTD33368.1 GNAT family acetyltransferase [Legionella nautarum]